MANVVLKDVVKDFKDVVAVFRFISYEEINWGGLAAAAMTITLPPLIMVLFIQKYIVKGLTAGAVKG